MTDAVDALVIGGGPGGATAALLLARAGWSVVLLESKEFPRRKVCGEYLSATNFTLLEHLGLAAEFRTAAGPAVQRVGLFAGRTLISAELPRPTRCHSLFRNLGNRGVQNSAQWGRALGREHLDTFLIRHAARAGVNVRQPWSATDLLREGTTYHCLAQSRVTGDSRKVRARVVVAAHGSWEPGRLPTQARRPTPRPGDLLGFKAHFHNSDLPGGLMPLLVFPGGYGGMVHSDAGRVSLSCCIRRDQLSHIRRHGREETAGEAVEEHILHHCLGARRALAGARREGAWLSAGPIRPGIRPAGPAGIFRVGNCAGEAHPVIAEGISMALQGAWLLARHLIAWHKAAVPGATLEQVGQGYARAWRKAFAPRIHTAAAVAHWAMRPAAVGGTLPLLRCFPGLLSWGARLSGKAARVVTA